MGIPRLLFSCSAWLAGRSEYPRSSAYWCYTYVHSLSRLGPSLVSEGLAAIRRLKGTAAVVFITFKE